MPGSPCERVSEEITPEPTPRIAEQLDRLIAEIARLGREQFRATTLLEGCGSSLDQLSLDVRGHVDQELREHAESARALAALEDQIRVRLVTDLLPVVDALQASISTGRGLLSADRQDRRGGSHLWQRIQPFLMGGGRARISEPDDLAAVEGLLEGLVLVEHRLLGLLEREGVRPIVAVGETFDPHYHVAAAIRDEHGIADGTIVAEEVRGYIRGDRILRHAEVVIARATTRSTHKEGVGHDTYRRD